MDVDKKAKRNLKGEGSLTKQKNGKLKLTITVGKNAEGKQVRKSFTGSSVKEVQKKKEEYIIKYSMWGLCKNDYKATLGDLIKAWKTTYEGSSDKGTFNVYCNKLKHWEGLYDCKLKDLTIECIQRYINSNMGAKYSERTIKQNIALLKQVFEYGVDNKLISVSPIYKPSSLRVPTRAKRKKEIVIPTNEDVEKLLTYLKEIKSNYYYMFLVVIGSGIRRGELMGLKWSDVDFQKKTISIRRQYKESIGRVVDTLKTASSYRTITIAPNILNELKDLKKTKKEDGFIFDGANEHYKYHYSYLNRINKKLNLSLDTLSFHSFRHYHATVLINMNVNPKTVSERLGHSSTTTTLNTYSKSLASSDEQAGNCFNDIVGKK